MRQKKHRNREAEKRQRAGFGDRHGVDEQRRRKRAAAVVGERVGTARVAVQRHLLLGVEQVVEVEPVAERRAAIVEGRGDEREVVEAGDDDVVNELVEQRTLKDQRLAHRQMPQTADHRKLDRAEEREVGIQVARADVSIGRDARCVQIRDGGFRPVGARRGGIERIDRDARAHARIRCHGVFDASGREIAVAVGHPERRRVRARRRHAAQIKLRVDRAVAVPAVGGVARGEDVQDPARQLVAQTAKGGRLGFTHLGVRARPEVRGDPRGRSSARQEQRKDQRGGTHTPRRRTYDNVWHRGSPHRGCRRQGIRCNPHTIGG